MDGVASRVLNVAFIGTLHLLHFSPPAARPPHPPPPRRYQEAAASIPHRAASGLPPERLDPVGEDDDGRDEDDDEHEDEDDGEQAEEDAVLRFLRLRPRLRVQVRRGAGAAVREPQALLREERERID